MQSCFVTRYLDLGEPLEIDIKVEYRFTDYGAAPITSGPADNWDPGWGPEIEIEDVDGGPLFLTELTQSEYGLVMEDACEQAAIAQREAREAYYVD